MTTNIVSLSAGLSTLPGGVRLQPDITAAAFKQRLTNEVILWHCLQAVDGKSNHGNGFLPLEMAKRELKERFNIPWSTAYRHILRSQGKVLSLVDNNRGSVIEIYGRKRVIGWLGIALLTDTHFRHVEDSDFNTLLKRRAQLYEAINKPAAIYGATPQKRQTIEERTGVSRVRQWRYDKLTHTRKIYNGAYFWDTHTQSYQPSKMEIFSKVKGRRLVNRRLPNTYRTKQKPGGTGMLKPINDELKVTLKAGAKAAKASLCPTSSNPEAATLERLFYFRESALTHAIIRITRIAKEGYYLIPPLKRMVRGRQEWCFTGI